MECRTSDIGHESPKRMSEHLPVMSPGPRCPMMSPGCRVVTEGEHVEGGRGGAVQHGGAPHSDQADPEVITVLRLLISIGRNALQAVAQSPHTPRVLIEWLRKPQNFVTSSGPSTSGVVGPWSGSLWCCGCPLSTLSSLCMTLRLLRPTESLIVRPPGQCGAGQAGRVGVGLHGGEVAVSRGESRTRAQPHPGHTRTRGGR